MRFCERNEFYPVEMKKIQAELVPPDLPSQAEVK